MYHSDLKKINKQDVVCELNSYFNQRENHGGDIRSIGLFRFKWKLDEFEESKYFGTQLVNRQKPKYTFFN
jgi:hypothetical protein